MMSGGVRGLLNGRMWVKRSHCLRDIINHGFPADLGYYDLRYGEVREEQANLAREAGIEGFAYWHYWFGEGRRLLERPFKEVLESGKPDFPFCLAWGNHSWTNNSWKKEFSRKKGNELIMEQKYPGVQDFTDHFYAVLPAFKDPRYITVDEKPLFIIFDPTFPELDLFISTWRKLAELNGLKGVHFVGTSYNAGFNEIGKKNGKKIMLDTNEAGARYEQTLKLGFDAVNSVGLLRAEYLAKGQLKILLKAIMNKVFKINLLNKYDHRQINKNLYVPEDKRENVYPTIIPNWDRTPRSGKNCTIYTNSTPDVFRDNIKNAVDLVKDKDPEHRIIILKSWNEWAEGNYVEPDLKYGKGFIHALSEQILY